MTHLTLLFFLLATFQLNAQIVTIPDANFKAELVNNSLVNTNGDSEIQVSEAQAFTGQLDVSFKSITDLTGIEEFTSLTILICHHTPLQTLDLSYNTALTNLVCYQIGLTSLDLTNNTALKILDCSVNSLTSLTLGNNTTLEYLKCSDNNLTSLDVSANTGLEELWCGNNDLTSLDISTNIGLKKLYVSDNKLTHLDVSSNLLLTTLWAQYNELENLDVSSNINLVDLHLLSNRLMSLNVKNGNNYNFTNFIARNNIYLNCIEVDDSLYSTINWVTDIDSIAHFSNNCHTTTTSSTTPILENINLFPNPTTKTVHINLGKPCSNLTIEVLNTMGQVVLYKQLIEAEFIEFDLLGSSGIYFVRIQAEKEKYILNVMKT